MKLLPKLPLQTIDCWKVYKRKYYAAPSIMAMQISTG